LCDANVWRHLLCIIFQLFRHSFDRCSSAQQQLGESQRRIQIWSVEQIELLTATPTFTDDDNALKFDVVGRFSLDSKLLSDCFVRECCLTAAVRIEDDEQSVCTSRISSLCVPLLDCAFRECLRLIGAVLTRAQAQCDNALVDGALDVRRIERYGALAPRVWLQWPEHFDGELCALLRSWLGDSTAHMNDRFEPMRMERIGRACAIEPQLFERVRRLVEPLFDTHRDPRLMRFASLCARHCARAAPSHMAPLCRHFDAQLRPFVALLHVEPTRTQMTALNALRRHIDRRHIALVAALYFDQWHDAAVQWCAADDNEPATLEEIADHLCWLADSAMSRANIVDRLLPALRVAFEERNADAIVASLATNKHWRSAHRRCQPLALNLLFAFAQSRHVEHANKLNALVNVPSYIFNYFHRQV
jgi:hypothetical protein